MSLSAQAELPDVADVHLAHARIRDRIRRTPVLNDPDLDAELGCRLYCKCENLQRSGAFKLRGASNAVARLREDGIEGDVATHSSGNHGAALALAARLDGREAHVVMPRDSSPMKIEAVRHYGGVVHFCEPGRWSWSRMSRAWSSSSLRWGEAVWSAAPPSPHELGA
jgi:threonine dehydratase